LKKSGVGSNVLYINTYIITLSNIVLQLVENVLKQHNISYKVTGGSEWVDEENTIHIISVTATDPSDFTINIISEIEKQSINCDGREWPCSVCKHERVSLFF
jgi:hypothetical protein